MSYKEHYFAHLLLRKIYQNTPNEQKMIKAIWILSNKDSHKNNKTYTSRQYEKARKEYVDSISDLVTINGITKTFKEWSAISGLNIPTIKWRIKNNWNEFKLLEPISSHKNKIYEFNGEKHTIREWAKILNIKENTIRTRLFKNISYDQIFKKEVKPLSRNISYNGKICSLAEIARINNINYRTLKYRIDVGYSLEDALSLKIVPHSGKKLLT